MVLVFIRLSLKGIASNTAMITNENIMTMFILKSEIHYFCAGSGSGFNRSLLKISTSNSGMTNQNMIVNIVMFILKSETRVSRHFCAGTGLSDCFFFQTNGIEQIG